MITTTSRPTSSVPLRTGSFVALLLLINMVMDGLPQVGSPLVLQIALAPISLLFLLLLSVFLKGGREERVTSGVAVLARRLSSTKILGWVVVLLELGFAVLFFYETVHFAGLGYRFLRKADLLTFATILMVLVFFTGVARRLPPVWKLVAFLSAYVAGQVLAIVAFPLNYLRSDMLPVVFWAVRSLLAGQNPYQHFLVADRIYDFPYLPGMLLVFAPAQALHLDLRWAAVVYLVSGMCLIYGATIPAYRSQVVLLIGIFVLCPYLQYRHELYTQGHFFSMILVFFLMQRRLFGWSAAAFGLSMVISQFSWVIFPFFLLNALRRGGWREVCRTFLFSSAAAAILMLPFVTSGAGNIAHNAVGQWDRLARPIARPINLSFWASYVVRPVHLKWVQLAILSGIFGFCWLRGRCADLADTLRWMIMALGVFILFNVLATHV